MNTVSATISFSWYGCWTIYVCVGRKYSWI